MVKRYLIYAMLVLPFLASGQEERKYIRDGYKAYMDEKYNEAEIMFRKAEEAGKDSYVARYNTSAALYKQQKLEESGERFTQLMGETSDPVEQARLLHNMGNVMLEGQQYKEAAGAYKRSLKLNPDDEDTRYNLAYALEKLREQQQQQEQNQDQQNQDQDDQQEQQQNQDNQQQEGEQDQQQQQEQQENEQQENEQQQNEQQDQQDQQQMQELSREEAERLLQAILQKEKAVKEKVDEQKAKAAKIKTEKDW